MQRGIQPQAARNAAMFQLAANMPTPILAEILGLAPHTATRWAALASRDWSLYTATPQQHQPLSSRRQGNAATAVLSVPTPMVEPADMVGPDSPVKGVTMKVAAYHSSNPSDPDVYHDYDDCPAGQQIPSWNKRSGTGGYPRCKRCIDKD